MWTTDGSSFLATLCVAGTLTFASPGLAQDTNDQTTGTEQAETPSIADDLSLGTDADAPSDIGQTYTRNANGDWEMRCLRTENPDNDPCQMYQLLLDEQNAPVVEVSLFRLPDGGQAKAGATIVVPLETSLQAQLTIRVDGGNAKRYPFAFCNPVGCYARIGLTEEDVSAFRRGNAATLTIVPAPSPETKVELALSLKGFTASYNEVSVIQQ